MSDLITVVKLIIAVQRILDLMLEAILEKRNESERAELRAAIEEVRGAETDEQKRAALKKLRESWRTDRVADRPDPGA